MQQRDSILGQVKYVRCVSLIELGVNSVSAEKGEGYDFDATTGFIQFWGELNTWYVRCVSLWHSRLSREHETPKAYNLKSATANHDRTGGIAAVGASVEFQ